MDSPSKFEVTGSTTRPDSEVDLSFDLNCWYINVGRVLDLIGSKALKLSLNELISASSIPDAFMRRIAQDVLVKEEFLCWARTHYVESLGRQIVTQTIRVGNLFTANQDFYGRRLKGIKATEDSSNNSDLGELHTKLNKFE